MLKIILILIDNMVKTGTNDGKKEKKKDKKIFFGFWDGVVVSREITDADDKRDTDDKTVKVKRLHYMIDLRYLKHLYKRSGNISEIRTGGKNFVKPIDIAVETK